MRAAGFWQGRSISLPKNQSTMNRIPLDEMYLLYSLYGFRDLTKEEQSRFTIAKFEYEPIWNSSWRGCSLSMRTRKVSRRSSRMHWAEIAQMTISMSM